MTIRKIGASILLYGMAAAGQGRRGMPNGTPEQIAAIARMNAALAPQTQRLAAVRSDLVAAALAQPRDDAAIRSCAEAVRAAEMELAKARATALAELQSTANRLSVDQIAALAAAGGGPGRGGYRTSMPHATAKQASALIDMATALQNQTQALNMARTQLTSAALNASPDDSVIRSQADAVGD